MSRFGHYDDTMTNGIDRADEHFTFVITTASSLSSIKLEVLVTLHVT